MRLINTNTLELSSSDDASFSENPQYAILSHRWEPGHPQVRFQDYGTEAATRKEVSMTKIRAACQKAREKGLNWLWVDTCCINKENAVEEAESIRSMFKWYRAATICLSYLYDVSGDSIGTSEWFKRGWTLQELLAPTSMEFFDRNWTFLGTRESLSEKLGGITNIDPAYLAGRSDFRDASVAQKMSWMAGRSTTRSEDIAYALLGVFDVFIDPRYGEGERAFVRLEQELLASVPDESIFAWSAPDGFQWPASQGRKHWDQDEWGLLAPSPACFQDSGDIHLRGRGRARYNGAFNITPTGVHFPIPNEHFWNQPLLIVLSFLPPTGFVYLYRSRHRKNLRITLNCWRNDSQQKSRPVQIHLRKTDSGHWIRSQCKGMLGTGKKVGESWGLGGIPKIMQCDILQPIISS